MATGRNQALLTMRIIWAVLLLGQLSFAFIVCVVIWPEGKFTPNPLAARQLTIVSAIMFAVFVPFAFFIRGKIYGGGDVIPRGRYSVGNLVFQALCEAVTFVGLMAMLFHGGPGGEIIIPALAVALQIVNFPAGTRLSD